mmetsp:Transcript_6125/g.38028  ORF Transcript_6125/g.38028 Transcript_6125/m.38028 type:complete len:105 (+) Transcript_6125:231-545(+)
MPRRVPRARNGRKRTVSTHEIARTDDERGMGRRIRRWKDADASPLWQDRIFGGLSGLYGAVALIALVRRAWRRVRRRATKTWHARSWTNGPTGEWLTETRWCVA